MVARRSGLSLLIYIRQVYVNAISTTLSKEPTGQVVHRACDPNASQLIFESYGLHILKTSLMKVMTYLQAVLLLCVFSHLVQAQFSEAQFLQPTHQGLSDVTSFTTQANLSTQLQTVHSFQTDMLGTSHLKGRLFPESEYKY